MEVYCNDCKYLDVTFSMKRFYDCVNSGSYIKKIYYSDWQGNQVMEEKIGTDDPKILNKNNDCKRFKLKWYRKKKYRLK